MKDAIGREIDYLRISITDRCNFRCQYCMPEHGVEPKSHEDILRFEEILQFVQAIVPLGISKIRITGGEPLVRKGIVPFIENLKAIEGIRDISMTTNGALLSDMAADLKKAGLHRVNISIDTLKSERFKSITRRGNISQVLEGIKAALDVGLTPVKINCVVIKGFNDDEIIDFINLTHHYPVSIRFIELMPLGEVGWSKGHFISAREIRRIINQELIPVKVSKGVGPAIYYQVPGALGSIGFIAPLSQHFCQYCNRMRLTSDGKLKPCLESDQEIDIKGALRGNKGPAELQHLFKVALEQKPRAHHMIPEHTNKHRRKMWQIGG